MNKYSDVVKLFREFFDRKEFSSNGDLEHYTKMADEWWSRNQFETQEDYEFRIKNFNRPVMGGIVHVF